MATKAAKKAAPRRPRSPSIEFFNNVAFGECARFRTPDGRLWLALPINKFKHITFRAHDMQGRVRYAQHVLSLLLVKRPELFGLLEPALRILADIRNTPAYRLSGLDVPKEASKK